MEVSLSPFVCMCEPVHLLKLQSLSGCECQASQFSNSRISPPHLSGIIIIYFIYQTCMHVLPHHLLTMHFPCH